MGRLGRSDLLRRDLRNQRMLSAVRYDADANRMRELARAAEARRAWRGFV